MSHGRRPRGPVSRISGISRSDGADAVYRVRSPERLSGAEPVEERRAPGRSFAEVLERYERGLHSSEPLPTPARRRPPLPPSSEDDESRALEPVPETFLGLLWLKLKGGR